MKKFYTQLRSISKTARAWMIAAGLLASTGIASAQVSSYSFAQSAGTYTPISGGTVLGVPSNDDTNFPDNPIGFSFCYNGVTYTRFGVNTNGWIVMGNAAMFNSYTTISSGTNNNVISAFNFDIQGDAATGNLRFETVGTAPNRTLVVQWTNYDRFSSATNNDTYNFQIRLSESNGNIDFVYGGYTVNSIIQNAQVGLRGNSNADFNNRQISNGLHTWATSVAGLTNTATCEVNNVPLIPTSGQTYTWSLPAAPLPPITPSFTAVTTTGMTLNWVDDSNNELNFVVQRSTDNITFTTVSTIASTSIATTGTAYNYVASGLMSGTLYYWRIFAANVNCGGSFLPMQQATLPGTMCGAYTVGPTGAYTSLTAAFAAVAANGVLCPLIFDLQAAYVSTVETFPLNIPNLGTGPATSITVRPELGATNLSITSNATQTINYNGANFVNFDGRPGSVGVVSHLTIENTLVTGTALTIANDASNNTFNYLKFRGVNTSTTSGVVTLGAATLFGNNNMTFTNNEFYDGATQPTNLFYAANSTLNTMSSGLNISNNLFHDWFNAASTSTAITISTGNTAATLANNSFYQTATRTFTSGVLTYAVNITPGSGLVVGNFTVTGNYFGGTAPLCGGTAFTSTGTIAHRFIGLQLNTGTGGANSIQGNTFRNFNLTTSSATTTTNGIWCAINLIGTNGANNVGNLVPNVIGSNTVNGQIVTTTSGSGGLTVGINSSASGVQNISNNQIGGITANSTLVTISSTVVGIQVTSGTAVTISGNIIGSTSLTSSLINAVSTGATAGIVQGILCSAFNSTLPGNQITNNVISNLTNQYAGTSTAAVTRGILASSGINTISGNTISNLSNTNGSAGSATLATVQGITLSSTTSGANQTVTNNTITNLANLALTGTPQVVGINASGSTLQTTFVHRNTISGIGSTSSGVAVIHGIQIFGGIVRVYNNFVNIGTDALGNSLTLSHEFNGIIKNTSNRATVAFNTVNVAGTGVGAGTANTFAYRRMANPAATPADSLYSNIFTNFRSNGASTGSNFAISINNTTNLLANGNNYFGNGTGFVFGSINNVNVAGLPPWQVATTQDANSFAVNPNYISATNLHINNAIQSALESRAVAMNINTDIDNDVRPGPVASVNGGGTGPDIGADEFDGIPVNVDIGIQLLVSPAASGCYTNCHPIRVRLRNYSTQTLNMAINPVTITGAAAGPNPASFGPLVIAAGTLAPNATLDTTVFACYDMTALGTYSFNFTTTQVNDFITGNDAMATTSVTVAGGTASVIPNPICLGSATVLTVSGQTNGGTIQWQESTDNITWTNIVGATTNGYSITPTDTTFYRAMICGLHPSTSDTVHTITVLPAVGVNASRCGAGNITLTGSGSGVLNWYTAATGGTSLATNDSLTVFIAATDTFYLENSYNSATVGTPTAPTCFPTYSSACSSADFINNFSTTGGTTNISNLATGCNGILPTNTTFFPTQIVTTVPGGSFNIAAQSGSSWSQGFRLWIDYNNDGDFADVGENVWASATSSTALNTATITVPSNVTAGPKRMRLMCRFATIPAATDYCLPTASFGEVEEYTLMVNLTCPATRVPVIATITPAPPITLASGNVSTCSGDPALLSVSSANAGYGYTWSPATSLNTTVGDSVLSSHNNNISYIVTALDTTSGCQITDTVSVMVNQTPVLNPAVNNDTVCSGTIVTLTPGVPNPSTLVVNGNTLNSTFTYPCPLGNYYEGSKHQMLYLASELQAAGFVAGYLGGLSYQIQNLNASDDTLRNFTVAMKNTGITSMTVYQSGLTTVYSAANQRLTAGLYTINFQTPFYWDGNSNIVVETCFNNELNPLTFEFTENVTMRHSITPFTSVLYSNNDNDATLCSAPPTGITSAQRPNTYFIRSQSSYTYNWSGPSATNTPTNDTTTAVTTTSGYYVLTITDTVSGCSATDSIFVHVNPTPTPNFGPDTAICAGSNLILDGIAGPNTYFWQDSTTNQTFTVNAIGTYHVLTTDSVT
ncbi:MAG: beta strand repeat-containing protein, partial [Bacteroidia bacterium]